MLQSTTLPDSPKMCPCIYIYMYVYVHICINIYIYADIYMQINSQLSYINLSYFYYPHASQFLHDVR